MNTHITKQEVDKVIQILEMLVAANGGPVPQSYLQADSSRDFFLEVWQLLSHYVMPVFAHAPSPEYVLQFDGALLLKQLKTEGAWEYAYEEERLKFTEEDTPFWNRIRLFRRVSDNLLRNAR